jgi:hypothetical protein
VNYGNQNQEFTVTLGFFGDGKIGEVFISSNRAGSQMDAIARDGAILLSLALQFGVPLKTIQHAITRNEQGYADTVIGAVIDKIAS